MDFVKNKLGIEVQFGKYAFMVYNVYAKMTIFHKFVYINRGVEIVPVKAFADAMSTGVSYFEQFVWDLESRGVSDIDIPVMIIGIDAYNGLLALDPSPLTRVPCCHADRPPHPVRAARGFDRTRHRAHRCEGVRV